MKRKNREFLMLAKTYDPEKHSVANCYVSVKRDGQRAFWDGGITRGVRKDEIPWANTNKDERYVDVQYSTGLWSRYGNVIHAPDWWLDELPYDIFLDGELYMGRGLFQETRKVVSTLDPGPGWEDISFLVFEQPHPEILFKTGKINNPNFQLQITEQECLEFLRDREFSPRNFTGNFDRTVNLMRDNLPIGNSMRYMKQTKLPATERAAQSQLFQMLWEETSLGGEGLIIRRPFSFYDPVRSSSLLKVKPFKDAEADVIGYRWGVEGKEGKHLCRMGALIVSWLGKEFSIGGFTDEERLITGPDVETEGKACAGEEMKDEYVSPKFPRGTRVTFRYVSLTDDGIPREARYWRS